MASSSVILCRYGKKCRYLKESKCRYYHPTDTSVTSITPVTVVNEETITSLSTMLTDTLIISSKVSTESIESDYNYRPTFYYNNNKMLPIRAGGVLFYRFNVDKNESEFLMINIDGTYEDFGGKTDACDKSIEDTISREAEEESNNIFTHKQIYDLLQDPSHKRVYVKRAKYLVYIIKTDEKYNPQDFGDTEVHDNKYRTVEWIPQSTLTDPEFVKSKLHARLKRISLSA